MNQQPKEEEIKPEYEQDLTKLTPQAHNWVARGLKVSCEGAGHPHHSHFLLGKVPSPEK